MKYFILIFLYVVKASGLECPVNVKCFSTVDRKSCSDGLYYREKINFLNCCPGCIPLSELDDDCRIPEDCAPGLTCYNEICTHDPDQSCDYYKKNDVTWVQEKYWQPDCLPNGMYASRQCKGDIKFGKCFCVTEEGQRIFGEGPWEEAETMTCECSTLIAKLRKDRGARKDISIHCNGRGNFELLQCDDNVCWCSNEKTGIPYTPIVPEAMVTVLPCFNIKTFGSQYLRKCDSETVNGERISKLLMDHGTQFSAIYTELCNYDGSYARVQRIGLKTYCAYRNQTKLGDLNVSKKNCNCAYDRYVAEKIEDKDFNLECDTNTGDYIPEQASGNQKFLVDQDGFPHSFTDITNKKFIQHNVIEDSNKV